MGSQRLLSPTTGRSMRHMSLRGLPVKKASHTSLAAHATLRAMAKQNGLCRQVKAMLKKSVDPYGALLANRTTSLECGYSPAQLLMGWQLRTSTLQPRWAESKQLRDRQEKIMTRQTVDYDRYHRAQPLSTLSAGDPVWVQDTKIGSQNG